ncbi:MAG: alpha/beta hydrolase [Cyclobacteriaceae bacterium]
MERESFEIYTAGGNRLHATAMWPEMPDALICLIHCKGQKSDDYDAMANFFMDHNMAFFTCDLHGHGQSADTEKHSNSVADYANDIEALCMLARSEFNEIPILLVGVGLGALATVYYLSKNKSSEISACILFDPWLGNSTQFLQVSPLAGLVGFFLPLLKLKNVANSGAQTITYKLVKSVKRTNDILYSSQDSIRVKTLIFAKFDNSNVPNLLSAHPEMIEMLPLPDAALCASNQTWLSLLGWINNLRGIKN